MQRVGKLVLNQNAANFFNENEQLAFSPAHIVPGQHTQIGLYKAQHASEVVIAYSLPAAQSAHTILC